MYRESEIFRLHKTIEEKDQFASKIKISDQINTHKAKTLEEEVSDKNEIIKTL